MVVLIIYKQIEIVYLTMLTSAQNAYTDESSSRSIVAIDFVCLMQPPYFQQEENKYILQSLYKNLIVRRFSFALSNQSSSQVFLDLSTIVNLISDFYFCQMNSKNILQTS